jgi:hypothetical protein
MVWLTVALSKGYQLSLDHIAAVVRFYGDLASCPAHDVAIAKADNESGVPHHCHNASRRCGNVFVNRSVRNITAWSIVVLPKLLGKLGSVCL